MADPQAVNTTADNTNSVIQWIINFIVNLAVALARGQYPWLNVWPVKDVINWLAAKLVVKIALPVKQLATEIVIDDQKEIKVIDAHAAKAGLASALKSGDKDAIKKASDNFDQKYASLVHYGGSSTNAH